MNNAHIISIGSLASFSRGLTYSGSDEVDYSSNVVLRSNNIDLATNTLNFDELKYISDAINIPEDKKLQRNSIFMCMSNGSKQHLGKVAFIDRDYPYAFGGFMGLIKPKEDIIIPKLLYYYFCSSKFKGFLSSIGNGANINNIKFVDIAKDYISVPEKTTQQSIIAELDKINELIRLKKEQLKDYDNLAQSIFYEMFGDPVVNEKGWEVKKLGEVCECITDGDHMPPPKSDTGIPFVTIGNVNKASRQIDFDNTYFVPRDYFDNIPNIKKPRRGDVLYTVTGSYGIPIIINYDKEFCFQRHIGLLRPKDFMSPVFLCMWALNDRTKGQADMVATGIAQKTVSLKSLRNFAIILPPLPLQQLFAQRIELIEQQKAEIQSTIADLETLLASRMQYWFD